MDTNRPPKQQRLQFQISLSASLFNLLTFSTFLDVARLPNWIDLKLNKRSIFMHSVWQSAEATQNKMSTQLALLQLRSSGKFGLFATNHKYLFIPVSNSQKVT